MSKMEIGRMKKVAVNACSVILCILICVIITVFIWFYYVNPNGIYLKNKVISASEALYPGSQVEELELFPSPSGYDITVRWIGEEGFIRWIRDGTKLYLNIVRWNENMDIGTSDSISPTEAEQYVNKLYRGYMHTIEEIRFENNACIVLCETVDPYGAILSTKITLAKWENYIVITDIDNEHIRD